MLIVHVIPALISAFTNSLRSLASSLLMITSMILTAAAILAGALSLFGIGLSGIVGSRILRNRNPPE